jgi:SAM-dependent methyltransferase
VTTRPDLIDSIEGFYVTHILDHLHRAGVLRALAEGAQIAAIARRFGFDRKLLTDLLDYVSLRSNVVSRIGSGARKRFALAEGTNISFLAHVLDQYVGAYGPCLVGIPRILKRPSAGRNLVDAARHARAFSRGEPTHELVALIEALELNGLLDIGCGGGQLLTTLARRRKSFFGIGIDVNPHMVTAARRLTVQSGLADRLDVRRSDFKGIAKAIAKRERDEIGGICAVSVANGFFGPDRRAGIDTFFAHLKRLFPGRLLVLHDYYGRLGSAPQQSASYKRTLIHDVAQILSSQGVPPNDLRAWRRIYARNSVKLLHALKGQNEGVTWFIHVVLL